MTVSSEDRETYRCGTGVIDGEHGGVMIFFHSLLSLPSFRVHSLTFWQKVTKAYQIFHVSFCYLYSTYFLKLQNSDTLQFYRKSRRQIIKIHIRKRNLKLTTIVSTKKLLTNMNFHYNPLTSIADRRFPSGIKIAYRDGQVSRLVG